MKQQTKEQHLQQTADRAVDATIKVAVASGVILPSSGTVSGSGSASGSGSVGGRLSNLLSKAGVTKGELKTTQGKARTSWEEEEDRNGSALDMDDYYKNLREWDFLWDWDRERAGISGIPHAGGNGGGKKRKGGGDGDGRNHKGNAYRKGGKVGTMPTPKTIPNTFSSRRQYQKLWAPLCLAETKAQFLSDASGNLPWKNGGNNGGGGGGRRGRNDNIGPVPVLVQPSMKDVGSNVDAMTIITSPLEGSGISGGGKSYVNTGPSYTSGDLVILASEIGRAHV